MAHERAHLARHGHFDAGTANERLLARGCTLTPDPHRSLWTGATTPVADQAELAFGSHRHPGHGPTSTIGTERPHLDSWIARGW